MEHHSSYSAPRSSRGSEHTRPAASRPSQRRSRSPKKGSSFGHILLCYILPFLAVNLAIFFIVTATPKIEMTISDTTDYKTLDVSFKVHSLLPLKKMTTTLESQPIEFQKEKGVYHAVLTNNGTLEVYVLSLNGMQAQDIEHIAVLDDTPPSFDEESVVTENGTLTITIEDSISGINYDSLYATDDAGTKILPDSYDKENGEVTFKLEEGSLTVYVEDMAGNPNQASFSLSQSGIDTEDRESKFPTDGKNGMNGTTATETENETKASETSLPRQRLLRQNLPAPAVPKQKQRLRRKHHLQLSLLLQLLNPLLRLPNLLPQPSPPLQLLSLLLRLLSPLPQQRSPPLQLLSPLPQQRNLPLRLPSPLLQQPQKQRNLLLQQHMNHLQRKHLLPLLR